MATFFTDLHCMIACVQIHSVSFLKTILILILSIKLLTLHLPHIISSYTFLFLIHVAIFSLSSIQENWLIAGFQKHQTTHASSFTLCKWMHWKCKELCTCIISTLPIREFIPHWNIKRTATARYSSCFIKVIGVFFNYWSHLQCITKYLVKNVQWNCRGETPVAGKLPT